MVTINGKTYGMAFTGRARIASSNWIALHEGEASVDHFRIMRAVCMINAYNAVNGIKETVKLDDFIDLPNREINKLLEEEARVFDADSKQEVEAVPKKGKNAKSTEASN